MSSSNPRCTAKIWIMRKSNACPRSGSAQPFTRFLPLSAPAVAPGRAEFLEMLDSPASRNPSPVGFDPRASLNSKDILPNGTALTRTTHSDCLGTTRHDACRRQCCMGCIVKINSVQMSGLRISYHLFTSCPPSSSGTAGLGIRGSPRDKRPPELEVSQPASIQDWFSASRSACSHHDQF